MTDKEAIIFFWGDPDLKDTYNCTCVFEEILISRENFDFYYDNGELVKDYKNRKVGCVATIKKIVKVEELKEEVSPDRTFLKTYLYSDRRSIKFAGGNPIRKSMCRLEDIGKFVYVVEVHKSRDGNEFSSNRFNRAFLDLDVAEEMKRQKVEECRVRALKEQVNRP